jgi:hypothetical protein
MRLRLAGCGLEAWNGILLGGWLVPLLVVVVVGPVVGSGSGCRCGVLLGLLVVVVVGPESLWLSLWCPVWLVVAPNSIRYTHELVGSRCGWSRVVVVVVVVSRLVGCCAKLDPLHRRTCASILNRMCSDTQANVYRLSIGLSIGSVMQ